MYIIHVVYNTRLTNCYLFFLTCWSWKVWNLPITSDSNLSLVRIYVSMKYIVTITANSQMIKFLVPIMKIHQFYWNINTYQIHVPIRISKSNNCQWCNACTELYVPPKYFTTNLRSSRLILIEYCGQFYNKNTLWGTCLHIIFIRLGTRTVHRSSRTRMKTFRPLRMRMRTRTVYSNCPRGRGKISLS